MSNVNAHRPGYKHTPLGWIPEEWEVKPLEHVAEIKQGVSKGKVIEPNSAINVPYMRVANVKDGRLDLNEIKYIQIKKEDFGKYKLQKKDILITEGGDPDKLGRGCIWNDEIRDCIFQNHLFRIRTFHHILLPEYSYNFFQSNRAKDYFLSCAKQTTGIASINSTQVKDTPIPIPALSEQANVCKVLHTWDIAIANIQATILKLKQRNRGLSQKLLALKASWKEVRISDVFERVTRKNTESNTNVVTISAQRGFVRQNDFFKKTVASEMLDNYYLVERGEFCYNKSYSNGYGWGAIKRLNDFEKAVVTTLYICFKLKNDAKYSNDFFELLFDACLLDKGLSKIAHEGGRAHGLLNVTPGDFFNLKITVPSYKEQLSIVKILSLSKQELTLVEQQLDLLQQQKKALLQKLLTGEIRVKVNQEQEVI